MPNVGYWRAIAQENRLVNLLGFGQLSRVWYVFPQGGGPRGSFTSFTDLKPNLRTRDIIIFGGVLREQVTMPDYLHDILIMGTTNRPYQATDSGLPITSLVVAAGATWLAPTSPTATTPLIQIPTNSAGWMFDGIMFGPPEDDAAIKIVNNGGIGSGHHVFNNLYFSGGFIGIEDNGGMGFTLTQDCRFRGHAGVGGGGFVCTSTANAVPLQNVIQRCQFMDNVNNFIASQSYSVIQDNNFDVATTNTISTVFNAAQGGNNHVIRNSFNIAAADFDPAGGVNGAATDVWYNYLTDTVESGQPAN